MIKRPLLLAVLFFGLIGIARADDAHPFPNPYVPARGHTDIFFIRLPASGNIKIFTIDGQEVRNLSLPVGHVDPFPWDVKNSSGKQVATGVYIYTVFDGDRKVSSGKIVVIR